MGHVDALSRCHEVTTEVEAIKVNAQLGDVKMTPEDNTNAKETGAERKRTPEFVEERGRLAAWVDHNDIDFRLQVTQSRDPKILKWRDQLETGGLDDYVLIDGLLYRRVDEQTKLLCVLAEMEENIIRLGHERVGHQSVDKTYADVRRHYWFPQMRRKIEAHITNCVKCIAYATPARVTDRNLYNIPKKPVSFDTIYIDHFGPLPSLISKRKYILVVVDAFTK